MRISKRFIKSSLIYTVAGTLPMASAIILLPFYLAGLSVSDFGALSICLSLSLLVQVFTTYSFDTSLYIHFHEFKNDGNKLSAFVSSAFILMLMIGAGVCILSALVGNIVFGFFFTEVPISFFPYGLMAAVTGIFQALFKVHSNLLQSREKPETFLWSNMVMFFLIAGLTISGLKFFPNSLIGPIGGRLIAALCCGMWALSRIFSEFGIQFNYRLLRESFQFNLYSFIYQIQQWVINYFDRFLMVLFLPLSSVGIYDFAVKCLLFVEFIQNGLHNSFYPKVIGAVVAQDVKGSTPEINRYYHGFTSIIMLLICICILMFPWLIETLASVLQKPAYIAVIQYLPYIALIYILKTMRLFFSVPYGALRYMKPLPVIYLFVSVIKIGSMLLLIKQYGIYGVIFSSVLSSVVEVVLLWYQVRERFVFKFNIFKIVLVPLLLFLMISLAEPWVGQIHPFATHLSYLLSCMGLLWWVYRQEIKLIDPYNFIK